MAWRRLNGAREGKNRAATGLRGWVGWVWEKSRIDSREVHHVKTAGTGPNMHVLLIVGKETNIPKETAYNQKSPMRCSIDAVLIPLYHYSGS